MPGFKRLSRLLSVFLLIFSSILPARGGTVRESLEALEVIVIPEASEPVSRTVAEAIREAYCPGANIVTAAQDRAEADSRSLQVAVEDTSGDAQDNPAWMLFQIPGEGPVRLVASQGNLLYALFCRVRDEWADQDATLFADAERRSPAFQTIVGEDGYYGFWRRFSVGYDPESAIREMARLGASHVIVNALPQPFAMEDGPPGEIYYRFYQYLPDLDQYVETDLNRGTYPPEYLQANLNFLREQAALAVKYGLVPGMHIANPRSVPESLLEKYPYLRGARVDHPFRSYRPRYTLTLAHPLVRWHYATLMQNLLREVPEIGFLATLINDSGAGFEYTESLYAGRNGGLYLVREWRPAGEIARKAAGLVIQYYQTLRDAARELNPDFRILMGLNNIEEEKQIIYDGLGEGLDRRVQTQRMDITEDFERNERLEKRHSYRVGSASAKGNPYIPGLPAPRLTYEALEREMEAGTSRLEVQLDPPSLAPYDINREVLNTFQLKGGFDLDGLLQETASNLVGQAHAGDLVRIWNFSDAAVRGAPVMPLYGGLGFAWYRFWVRPFVPDIEAIPVRERAYYEDYMLTTFNNPHNVDLQADALWKIHSREECSDFVRRFDEDTLPMVARAIRELGDALDKLAQEDPARRVMADLEVRLRAYRCYSLTLRNVAAWIVAVHGYLDAEGDSDRAEYLRMTREMVQSELRNTEELLELWKSTDIVFMPIHPGGEWMHDYGPNFGQLLENKIRLMRKYGGRLPRIDPDYMWRLPDPAEVEEAPPVPEAEYLKYK